METHCPFSAAEPGNYVTSNGEYGKFYGICEKPRGNRNHDWNAQGTTEMVNDLKLLEACLDMHDCIRPRSSLEQYDSPKGPCCSKDRGDPHCRSMSVETRTGSPVKLISGDEWHCLNPCEPETLEDHVRICHPRLAPKLQFLPKGFTRNTTNRRQVKCRSADASPGSSRGRYGTRMHEMKKMRRSPPASPKQGNITRPKQKNNAILPASHRYGYYRYFGAAGQGAKTSKVYNPKGGEWNPMSFVWLE